MKKTQMSKVLLGIIIALGLIFITTQVFADDTIDLSNTLQGGGIDFNSIDLNSIDMNSIDLNSIDTNNIDLNSIDTNNIDLNSINTNNITGNGTNDTNTNTTTNANNSTTNTNSSSYAESDIPHAGIESSVLTIAAFIVCAVIGIYTFMKLSDYSNI